MKVDFLCMYACLCIFVCVYFCGVCVCNVDMPLCAFEVHLMLGTERGRRLGGDDGQSNVIPAAVFFSFTQTREIIILLPMTAFLETVLALPCVSVHAILIL